MWAALNGPHQRFSLRNGRAVRYRPEVARFAAMESAADPVAWNDLEELARDGAVSLVGVTPDQLQEGWQIVRHLLVAQMVDGPGLHSGGSADDAVEALDESDLEQILGLIAKTEPGPFQRGTIELGGYFGIRADVDNRPLVAMAGQRLATGAWREVSAVCTDPAYQGRGFARRLIDAVVGLAHARGERAFLHVLLANPAMGLYQAMGFETRQEVDILVVKPSSR